MNCNEARKRWHLRFDDEGRDEELDAHLSLCASCREYDREMRQLADALDELRVGSDDPGAWSDRPPETRAAGVARSPWFARPLGLLRVAAVLALVVGGGLYFGSLLARPGGDVKTNDAPNGAQVAAWSDPPTLRLSDQSAEKYLAVAAPTSQADVQVIWLYPRLSSGDSEDDQ
jgi:hypothetical protein